MKTKSEIAAEELFCSWGVKAEKIPESSEKSPDYCVHFPFGDVIVEVKQFEPTKEEVEIHKRLPSDGFSISKSFKPGNRVRKKITSASPQLRKLASGKFPAILLLYNNRPFEFGNPANSYEVKVAMYGMQTLQIESSTGGLIGQKFGGSRKVTETDNIVISSLAVLDPSTGNAVLSIYHNSYATIPLKAGSFTEYGAKEFVIELGANNEFGQWAEVHGS